MKIAFDPEAAAQPPLDTARNLIKVSVSDALG